MKYIEAGNGCPRTPSLAAIRAALETAGIEFMAENGGGEGVRLRKQNSAAGTQTT
nr:hypothetical protein [Roseomonas aerilata]